MTSSTVIFLPCESVYSRLSNEQVHDGLLEVPALPGGVQDEEGHGDDSSVAVLAGKLSK